MGRQKSFVSFIAIPLPQELRRQIAAFQDQIKRLDLPLSWELPEKLHITLHYLGKIDDSSVHKLKSSLSDHLANYQPFSLKLSHVDYFYKRHGDSVLMLRLENDAEIKNLEKSIRQVLFAADFSPPHRFDPHLTIARLKRLRHPNQVKQVLSKAAENDPKHLESFFVDEIHILQSLFWQNENTSQYRFKAAIKLGKPASEE